MKHFANIIGRCSFGSLFLLSHSLYYKLVGSLWYLIPAIAAFPIWCTECRRTVLWRSSILLTWFWLWIKFFFEECEVAHKLWKLFPLSWIIRSFRWELNTSLLFFDLSEHVWVLCDLVFDKFFHFIYLRCVENALGQYCGGRRLHGYGLLGNRHPPLVVVEIESTDVVGAHVKRLSLSLNWTRSLDKGLEWLTRTFLSQRLWSAVLTLHHNFYIIVVHFLRFRRLCIVLLFENSILHAIKQRLIIWFMLCVASLVT